MTPLLIRKTPPIHTKENTNVDRDIPVLPIELWRKIFCEELHPIEAERIRSVSREWNVLYLEIFQSEKSLQRNVVLGLCHLLPINNYTWLILSLIRNRKGSQNDETIAQLCMTASRWKSKRRHIPNSTQMIIGLGKFLIEGLASGGDYFKNIKIPKYIKKTKGNEFTKFIVGLKETSSSALKWKSKKLKKASQNGVASATLVLAYRHFSFSKIPVFNHDKKIDKALELARTAAQQGSSMAAYLLSRLLETDEKYLYLQQAAEAGNQFAILEYAKFLNELNFNEEAKKWFDIAEIRGIH